MVMDDQYSMYIIPKTDTFSSVPISYIVFVRYGGEIYCDFSAVIKENVKVISLTTSLRESPKMFPFLVN